MTADIRAAARLVAHERYIEGQTDDAYTVRQEVRAFITGAVWGAARVTPTREAIALAILMVTQGDVSPEYAWSVQFAEVQDELLAQADAVLQLLAGLAEGESE